MKKQLVMGMAAMVVAMSFSNISFAAGAAKSSPKEVLEKYSKEVKDSMFGKGSAADVISDHARLNKAIETIVKVLKIDGVTGSSLKSVLSGSDAAARLESFATIAAAKNYAVNASTVEGKSIDAAASAVAKLIVNARLTGENPKAIEKAGLSDVSIALKKMETLPESILVKFESAERDSYTAILKKHGELIDKASFATSEEAFVQAIMDVKGISKDKAMELIKKLKDCLV